MRTRSLVAATAAILLSALVGGVFGKSALATADSVPDHYKTFTSALSAIQTQYAQPVESDRLVYGAINGMLQTLDPHSSFMDPRTYAQMRERQEGRYFGLGLTISAIDGDITAIRVFEGSPAFQNGIRRGDVIASRGRRQHQGLDHRADGGQAEGAEGHVRQHRRAPQGVRARARDEGDARPGQHPEPVGVVHDRCDHRLRRYHRLRRAHRRRPRRRARGAHQEGHEAPGARPARQPRRSARPGHSRHQPVRAEGLDGGLHARPRLEFRFRLPRHRHARLHQHPDDYAGQSQQRQRLGDRVRRVARLRPLARRRRNDLRQGPRAVGVSRQRRRGPGADHRALLHAERPVDSAPVGRHVRRVPDLYVEGSERARRRPPIS